MGSEHPAVAADIAALAALVEGQGRLDETEALYRRAPAVFESALGPDHDERGVGSGRDRLLPAQSGGAAGVTSGRSAGELRDSPE